jgi:glycosyltransferase involved in cell wall biosynthesis
MVKVSVVIPLYNKEPYIERAISSVLNQKIQDLEIIIINDGSTDQGPEVVKSIKDSRIHLINQKNSGVSIARNRGIKESRANLIAFLDADDEWLPNFLDSILKMNKEYPKAGLYATAYEILDPYGKNTTSNKELKISSFQNNIVILNYFQLVSQGMHPISSSSVCIPKKVFHEIEGFPVGETWGEDTYMWGKISLCYPIAYSFEIGAVYHMEALNRSINNKQSVKEHPFVKVARESLKNREIPTEKIEDFKEYIAFLEIITANKKLQSGENKEALKLLFHCKTKRYRIRKIYRLLLSLVPSTIYLEYRNLRKRIGNLYIKTIEHRGKY